MTVLRPTDIALSLSPQAREDLLACSKGYFWVAKLTGAPFELMQAKLVGAQPPFVSGKGFLITPTGLGRDVVGAIEGRAE